MTNVEQEDKKYIVNKLRNELRDISLAFNDLKNSWLIGNALKKINSVKVINELNSNALKSEDELFDLYLSNKTSLNMFASHMLNQEDYQKFVKVFNIKELHFSDVFYQEGLDVLSKYFSGTKNEKLIKSYDNAASLKTRHFFFMSIDLEDLKKTKINQSEKKFVFNLLKKELFLDPSVTPLFSDILVNIFNSAKGNVPVKNMEAFVEMFKDKSPELSKMAIPVEENENTEAIQKVKNKLVKLCAGLHSKDLNINEFDFLLKTVSKFKKFDIENNLNVINEHKESLNQLLFFSDGDVYNDFLKLTGVAKIESSPMSFNPQRHVLAMRCFLDACSTLGNFARSMRIDQSLVGLANLDLDEKEKFALTAMYIEHKNPDSEKQSKKEIAIENFKVQVSKVLKKVQLTKDESISLDDYFKTTMTLNNIGYEHLQIPQKTMCFEAEKIIDGEKVSFVVPDTSELISPTKGQIIKILSNYENFNISLKSSYVGIDKKDGSIVIFPVSYKRYPAINFENNYEKFKNQKDFCDIDVLNEVITRELMSKKDDGVLNKPMVIKHRDILGCLKNVEITKDGIEIELAQLDVEQMSKNPSRAFPIKKILLEKNIDLHSLRATDTLTMLFMQNIVMVKSNMVIKNQVENEQGFKNKRV